MSFTLHQLTENEVPILEELLAVFGEVFDDSPTYTGKRPSANYLRSLLAGDSFIALVALQNEKNESRVIGGLAAYELKKFEQERSEIYVYDLAVLSAHRRRGVATALIEELQKIAAQRGAWVIFVQADTQPEDEPAIALYSKLGAREDVLHFDIPVPLRTD